MNSIEITDWMRNQMLLKEQLHCFHYKRYVHLRSESGLIANAIYGIENNCKSIIDRVCYHTAIMMVYEDRNGRSLYGSDLHKALATWVQYNVNRPDRSNRVVMLRQKNSLGIYRGYPD